MCKGVKAIRFLVIVQKAAAVPPAASFVFRGLWGLPSPAPFERHGGRAFGRVISDELNVGIILQVWVRMELSCDQVIQFFRVRRVRKRETGQVGVSKLRERTRHAIYGRARGVAGLGLANNKCKVEDEFIIIM